MKTVIIAYIPVIHQGYLKFFDKYPDVPILVLDPASFPDLKYPYKRDIRALSPSVIVKSLQAIYYQKRAIGLFQGEPKEETLAYYDQFIFPDEDISKIIAEKFPKEKVKFEDAIRLRWDMSSAKKGTIINDLVPVINDAVLADTMKVALKESVKSSDWWREVGCLGITKEGERFVFFNRHMPNEQTPYIDGDPRSDFGRGECFELSSAFHAEAALVAHIASLKNVSLEGAKIFVTTFPCPGCAMLLVGAKVSEVYFKDGYSLINAKRNFDEAGIPVFRVEM